MVSPELVSATPWNHADPSHSTSFETASKTTVKRHDQLVSVVHPAPPRLRTGIYRKGWRPAMVIYEILQIKLYVLDGSNRAVRAQPAKAGTD
jgi:hypothetical protein